MAIPQKPVKISQYADDGIIFLNNRNEMCSTLNLLTKFGEISGLKLNVEKCEGFWLGRDRRYYRRIATFLELSGQSKFDA